MSKRYHIPAFGLMQAFLSAGIPLARQLRSREYIWFGIEKRGNRRRRARWDYRR